MGRLNVPQGVTVVYGEPDRIETILTDTIAAAGGDVIRAVRGDRRLNILGYQPQSLVLQPDGATPAPAPEIEPSLRAWTNARAINTADAYRVFIFAFPRSPFAEEARSRLDALEVDPARLAEQQERALNLSRNERRARSNASLRPPVLSSLILII